MRSAFISEVGPLVPDKLSETDPEAKLTLLAATTRFLSPRHGQRCHGHRQRITGQPAAHLSLLCHSWLLLIMLPGDAQSSYLLLGKEVLDQGAHHLLWGPGCADVGEDKVAMCLLSIADPA